jgi:hypothetical protein
VWGRDHPGSPLQATHWPRVIDSGARGKFTFRGLEQRGPFRPRWKRTIEDVEAVVTRVVRHRARGAGGVQWVRRHSAR